MTFYYKYAKEYKTVLRLRRKRSIIRTVKNVIVEIIMYPHLGFYVCLSCGVCGDDIFVIGYNESTIMHKKRKCIYKRDDYFQSKVGKFLCREPLKILDSVMRYIRRRATQL